MLQNETIRYSLSLLEFCVDIDIEVIVECVVAHYEN